MKHKKEKCREKAPFSERLCRALDIQPDMLPGQCMIEVRGQNAMTVKGGGKILCYTPEQIRIALHRGALCVSGKRLVCISYCVGAIGVEGWIEKVEFEGGNV